MLFFFFPVMLLLWLSSALAYQPMPMHPPMPPAPPPVPAIWVPAQPVMPLAYPAQPYWQPVAPAHRPFVPQATPQSVTAPTQTKVAPVIRATPVIKEEALPLSLLEAENRADESADPVSSHSTTQLQLKDWQSAFINKLTPIIQAENQYLRVLRSELMGLLELAGAGRLDDKQRLRLEQLAGRYRVTGDVATDTRLQEALLARIDTIPMSMVLAQAINESGWGRSRFAREGNNLFGIWTYDQSKGIKPKASDSKSKHYVRRFDDLGESVRYYLHNLNTHPAYAELREGRALIRERGQQPSGLALAGGLLRYSAKGELYVQLIRELIQRYPLDGPIAG